jgi:hypothetical protein
MKVVLIFTVAASVLFIAAYYLLVRYYYWGPTGSKEKNDHDKRED